MDKVGMYGLLANAVDALMLPHENGEAASIASAFHEISLGLMEVDINSIHDDNIRHYLQKAAEFMNTADLSDPDCKGLYTVKAETMNAEDKREFCHAVRELESLFRDFAG